VEFPFEIAARRIHRVQVLVATAEKYGAIDHQWAGQEHVVHVGIGLRPGLQAMQAARLEAASPSVANFQSTSPLRALSA